MTVVADASVLLAVLNREDGWQAAAEHLRGARLSTVNYSEVLAKASDQGAVFAKVRALIEALEIELVPFTADYADTAAELRPGTRYNNVSFADRACLAQAIVDRLPIVTGDRVWSSLDLGVEIIQIR